MASITSNGSKGHHKFTLTVTNNLEATSIQDNASTVSFSFGISSLGGGWNWEQWGANITYVVTVNGIQYTGSIANYDGYSNVTLKSGAFPVKHNTDGNKTISFSFSVTDTSGQNYTCGNASASGTLALATIPRYLSITSLYISSKTETSAVVSWSVSDPRDSTYYSFDNGATWIGSATDGESLASDLKSGTFNIANLTANTTYNIKVKIKRTDSQLWTFSDAVTFTTYDYPYCTDSPNFTIGDNLTLTFYNPLGREIRAVGYAKSNGSQIFAGTTTKTSLTGFNVNDENGGANAQYASIPNDQSGEYKVVVTWNGVSKTRDNRNTYSVRGNEIPTINTFYYVDDNATIVALTGNNQHIVQNYSSLVAKVGNATANNEAGGISKYVVECNGKSVQSTTAGNLTIGAINSNRNVDLKLTVTDSRGLTASKTITVTILAHSTPTAIVTLERLNNYEDETYLTVDGSVSSLNSKNTMAIKYRYKLSGGSYGSYVTVADRTKQTLSLDKNNAYIFEVVVTDSLGATFTKEYVLNKGMFPLFIDTKKNSVGINCFPEHEFSLEVNGLDISTIKEFTKSLQLSPNTWTDVGINGQDLETGTYIMQVYMNDRSENTGQWNERISGILTWFEGSTNSEDADEIPISKSGHAKNAHNIKLRTTRTLNGGRLKLQIYDDKQWYAVANVVFRFKRLL